MKSEEIIFLKQKLLTLKLTAATELNARINKRRDLQNKAFAKLSMLDYYIEVSYRKKLINSHTNNSLGVRPDLVEYLGGIWTKVHIPRRLLSKEPYSFPKKVNTRV